MRPWEGLSRDGAEGELLQVDSMARAGDIGWLLGGRARDPENSGFV